jgi:hypothetical protein
LLVGRTAASTLARCCPLLPRLARSLGSARLGSARPEGKGEGGGVNGSSGLVRILLPSCVYDANQSDEVGGLLEVGGNGT